MPQLTSLSFVWSAADFGPEVLAASTQAGVGAILDLRDGDLAATARRLAASGAEQVVVPAGRAR